MTENRPPLFVAYPSGSPYRASMAEFVSELRGKGSEVVSWEEEGPPGYIWDAIRADIDRTGIVLGEATIANENVLFELGYAIGSGRHAVQLLYTNAASPVRIPALDPIFAIQYGLRDEIHSALAKFDHSRPPLRDVLLRGQHQAPRGNRLYFVPSPTAGDVNGAVQRACESLFPTTSADYADSEYQNLGAQVRNIAASRHFVGILVSHETKNDRQVNAQMMLYAGIAAGLGLKYVLLQHEPHRRLLDLGENVVHFVDERDAVAKINLWLVRTAAESLRTPYVERFGGDRLADPDVESPLEVDLGSLDAHQDAALEQYFLKTPQYRQARRSERHLFFGAKGSGKTAIFLQLGDEMTSQRVAVVRVSPSEFEFPRLAAVFDTYFSETRWEFVYGSFWRFIFLTEILQAVQDKFSDFLLQEAGAQEWDRGHAGTAHDRAGGYASALLAWIRQNGDVLSLDFASRVRWARAKLGEVEATGEQRIEEVENLLQHARLYEIERHLQSFARQFQIWFLVDDLDRSWSPGNASSEHLLVSMLNEIHRVRDQFSGTMSAAIFLRRDVFTWLQANDPEILKRDPTELVWTDQLLTELVAERIHPGYRATGLTAAEVWQGIFPAYVGDTRVIDFVMSRSHRRPRYVLLFCREVLSSAQSASRQQVEEPDFDAAWEVTGGYMLSQIALEYEARLPRLRELMGAFLDRAGAEEWRHIAERLTDIVLGMDDVPPWMIDGLSDSRRLLEGLYEAELVGVQTSGGSVWFASDRPLEMIWSSLATDFQVVVHPAFVKHLRCR